MITLGCNDCLTGCRIIDLACFKKITSAIGVDERKFESSLKLAQEYRLANIIQITCLEDFCAALGSAASLSELADNWKDLAENAPIKEFLSWWTYFYYLTIHGALASTHSGEAELMLRGGNPADAGKLDAKTKQVLGLAQSYSGKLKDWFVLKKELFPCYVEAQSCAGHTSMETQEVSFRNVIKL